MAKDSKQRAIETYERAARTQDERAVHERSLASADGVCNARSQAAYYRGLAEAQRRR